MAGMQFVLTNGQVVTPREVLAPGTVVVQEGVIQAVDAGRSRVPGAVDCEGDLLMPGLVDLHTDNIERHLFPRPGVRWPSVMGAVLAHDREMIAAGVTTVLDALSLGDYDSAGTRRAVLPEVVAGLTAARAAGALRADHRLHLRCEISDEAVLDLFEPLASHPLLRLVSVMDHTPGQRQWRDLAVFRAHRERKNGRAWSDAEFEAYVEARRAFQSTHAGHHQTVITDAARRRAVPLASHDDTTEEDVRTAHRDGVGLSEFPTTLEAAREARALGLVTLMGSPNIVLGRSHSGNVAAKSLLAAGLLDVLASDYVPASLLEAVLKVVDLGCSLPQAVSLASTTPAKSLSLVDRGQIAAGLKADLIRVSTGAEHPIVQAVWQSGKQVH